MRTKHIWKQSEIDYLKIHYPDARTDLISKTLGLPISKIYSKAKKMNLKKSDAFLNSADSGRTDGKRGSKTRFQSGQSAWNKGKEFVAGGNSALHRYKPGQRPFNEMPIGSLRINGDGYLDRKISNAPGSNNERWKPVHRLVWIDANGPVPENHMIVFKPGMRTNVLEEITLDRLECISRADHARRHHPYSRGEEFGNLTRLKGAITRHVNRIIRNSKETTA